jgi:anion-transporting  ArsA/GET3 family ATPase
VHAAQRGLRTLVCELDAKGSLAAALSTEPLRFEARQVRPNLFAMAMDTEASLREYLSLNLRVPILTKLTPFARMLDFVASAAPGVREILTVGKLCWDVRESTYDLVIADAAASGHVVGQLAAPEAINDLVAVGLIRGQTSWMLDILRDPARTGAVLVTTGEEIPVAETLDLAARLRAETVVSIAAVVVNRALPELFAGAERDVVDKLRRPATTKRLAALIGPGAEPLLDLAALSTGLRRARSEHLSTLRAGLPDVPHLNVPELFGRLSGMRSTSRIAELLADEITT